MCLISRVIKSNSINFLRPVVAMIFCNSETTYPESREIWRTILEHGNIELINQLISLRRTTSPSTCLLFNSMIVMRFKTFRDIESLLLLLSSTKYLMEYSLDPTSNIQILVENMNIFEANLDSTNIALFLIAEIIQLSSITYIPLFTKLLDLMVKKKFGNLLILHMVLDGLIQTLAYPSFASKEMGCVEKLVNYFRSENFEIDHVKAITSNVKVDVINSDSNLMNAHSMCKFIEKDRVYEFQTIASENDEIFWTRNHLVLRGYLHSNKLKFDQWNIVFLNLIKVSKSNDVMKHSLIMPLLFKLSESSDARIKMSILQNLIQLGPSNEIFSTVKALSNGMIRSMAIDLHLRMWKIEPRTYPFLHKVLVEKSNKDSEDIHLKIAIASAIKDICDLKPHHGSDLVSLISEILNQSLDSKDSEIAASLSIKAITLLCQNHIISITSTWKAINLTTRYEKRPRVITSLCDFFAIIPKFKRSNLEYENLMKEILARLFYMIQWSDAHGIKCALEAMKSWNYDSLTLDMIPDTYRENIALPEAPAGMEVSILDLEVPGECYVQLLTKVNPSALGSAGELVSTYIEQEISEYRSGHYLVKEGQMEPTNYKTLPKQSIVKALVNFVIQQATTKKKEKIVDEKILIEALNVLSRKYSRPLPPLNWCFLHELIHKSHEIKSKCLAVAAKQSVISGTAKRLVENFLLNIDETLFEDVAIALDILPNLCNGISNDILKTFFERITNNTCPNANIDEKIYQMLTHEKDIVHRENLATIISTYINRNQSLSTKIIRAIPSNILNAIHLSPKKKIYFRCEILKENENIENAILWVNELILEQFMRNEHRDFFITSFIYVLIESKCFPKKKWLNELIILTQNKMVEKDLAAEDLEYLLDIFTISIICISGFHVLLDNRAETISNRYQLFAQSTELLSRQNSYDDAIGNVFEFLYYVLNHRSTSESIRMTFVKAIILCKNHQHFKKLKVWQKILQLIIS